jgi:glucosamine 6-phosphate synthetase-like amidotransferase/phosphosugar isomerase protein
MNSERSSVIHSNIKPTRVSNGSIFQPVYRSILRHYRSYRSWLASTAYYAAFIAKYWFEIYARLFVEVDIASEYWYRATSLSPGDVSMVVSRSGETAGTLACLG